MSAAITLWSKQMRKSLRNQMEMTGMLIQPVLWVVLFGVGMGSLLGPAVPGGKDFYLTFMLPGIVALTASGGAIGGGSTWLNERLQGIVKEYLAAPIPRLSILLGNALSIVSKGLIQALVIVIVGLIVGANLSLNPLGWLGTLLLVGGYTLGFAGMAIAFASSTDNTGAYHSMIMLFNLPLLFLSNSLYPLETMPTWMRIAALVNPTTYVVTGSRIMLIENPSAVVDASTISLWLCFLVIAVFALLGMWWGYSAFRRSIK
jgi:ABC-2 type transport system permease protein